MARIKLVPSDEKVIEEFARRRRRQLILWFLLGAAAFAVVLGVGVEGLLKSPFGSPWLLVLVPIGAIWIRFSYLNFRCPSCDTWLHYTLLGWILPLRHFACPACGCKLR